jgi:geranylgeranyl pyrophosphate synthase
MDGESVAALAEFGVEWGIAFQILDDCLDLESTGEDKPAGTDHLLGLFGAPTLAALRSDTSGVLRTLLLAPTFSGHDLLFVRELVSVHGGLTAARDLGRTHADLAFAALGRVPDGPARRELATLAGRP